MHPESGDSIHPGKPGPSYTVLDGCRRRERPPRLFTLWFPGSAFPGLCKPPTRMWCRSDALFSLFEGLESNPNRKKLCFSSLRPMAFVTVVGGQGVSTLSDAVVFILQVWPSGHPSFLSLQVESPSLPQALRTCTGWRRFSGAPAMPSPSPSPATLTTASRIQCSRDELGWVPRTVSRSLSVPPWCRDTAPSARLSAYSPPISAHCCCTECLMS